MVGGPVRVGDVDADVETDAGVGRMLPGRSVVLVIWKGRVAATSCPLRDSTERRVADGRRRQTTEGMDISAADERMVFDVQAQLLQRRSRVADELSRRWTAASRSHLSRATAAHESTRWR
jgi:hypothetical protein